MGRSRGSPASSGRKRISPNGSKPWALNGPEELYKGETAEKIAEHFEFNRGLLTSEDLAACEEIWSEPISTTYRNHRVLTYGPGSSGMTIIQWLNILEGYDLESLELNSADHIHLVSESKKLGFLDDDIYNTGMPGADFPLKSSSRTNTPPSGGDGSM